MDSASSSTPPPTTLIYKGPAGVLVDSFQKLSADSLTYSNPHWKDYEHPRSSMIPPISFFRHSDKSDKDTADEGNIRQIVTRRSESAERLVHKVLCDLIAENFQGPFIAVQGVNLQSFRPNNSDLIRLLPLHLRDPKQRTKYKDCFREYDFIVIGPKIGYLMIEVKSSHFVKDFENDRKLPARYNHGTRQLKSADILVNFLKRFAGISCSESSLSEVHKVLFTPNLEQERYDRWIASLNEASKRRVDGEVIGIDQWFHENVNDLMSQIKLITNTSRGIPVNVYESLAPILVGLASVKIFRSSVVELDMSRIRESDAVYRDSWRVHQQDALETLGKRTSPGPADVEHFRTIILTPRQLEASKVTRSRHLILGAAGVGKTLVLQTKVLELLERGKSITVFTSKNYRKTYKTLFHHYDKKYFLVKKWKRITGAASVIFEHRTSFQCEQYFQQGDSSKPNDQDLMIGIMEEIFRSCTDRNLDLAKADEDEIMAKRLSAYVTSAFAPRLARAIMRLLSVFHDTDCILVDDSFDSELYKGDILSEQLAVISLMLISLRHKESRKLLWIALDPYAEFCNSISPRPERQCRMPLFEDGPYKDTFALTCLNRVLRCPQSVYDISYGRFQNLSTSYELNDPKQTIKPELGHKIQGLYEPWIFETVGSTSDDNAHAYDTVWEKLERLLPELVMHGFTLEQTAIITMEDQYGAVYSHISRRYKDYIRTMARHNGEDENALEEKVNGLANVFTCHQVSSMEWSVVIVIVHGTRSWIEDEGAYRFYRACSRATGKLIVIKMIRAESSGIEHLP